jgi:hypothetical protein
MLLFGLFFCGLLYTSMLQSLLQGFRKIFKTHCFDFVFTPNLLFIGKMSRIR